MFHNIFLGLLVLYILYHTLNQSKVEQFQTLQREVTELYPRDNLGTQANFSYLDQNIAQGNPVSWAGNTNPFQYTDKLFTEKPKYTYFGSPNPLLQEIKPMESPKDSMFYFANAEFSPECCQGGAPYSTSSGCVCVFPKPIIDTHSEKLIDVPIPGPNSWQL